MHNLIKGEVHVWSIPLQVDATELQKSRLLLSPEELRQADRFAFPELGRRYAVAHAALRVILASYSGTNPLAINFETNPFGKPGIPNLSFNLSHSNEMALLAVTAKGDIGIDIEFAKRNRDMDLIVEKTFAQPEWEEYRQMPAHLRERAFYTGWPRKEAFIKACGKGLSCDLKAFATSMNPDSPATLMFLKPEISSGKQWSILDLPVPQGYFAALVVEGPISELRHFTYPKDLS